MKQPLLPGARARKSRSAREPQIEAFLTKYSPDIAAQLADARARLRSFFPRGFELVFDNYNALVFGFSPTQHASKSFISVAGYPRWVTLFFLRGATLHDPQRLLCGRGKQVRSIRLGTPADINQSEVEALIAQAIGAHRLELAAAPILTTIIKVEVTAQRSRRPASKTAKVRASLSRRKLPSRH